MKKLLVFMFLTCLLSLSGFSQGNYNYSSGYNRTLQHYSNKAATRKALAKKAKAKNSKKDATITVVAKKGNVKRKRTS